MEKQLQLKLITPNGVKYNDIADSVTIKTTEGYMTVLPNHMPVIGSIAISKLIWKAHSKKFEGSISGGILTVAENQVSIITDAFEFKDKIDIRRAQDQKRRAEELLRQLSKTDNVSEMKRATISLQKAINRITSVK